MRRRTLVELARDTVINEKELEKLYVDVCGKEIPFIEWIKSITADMEGGDEH